ncbi:MAG TPA: hypothetical protein VF791_11060 [Pyrinomonadaceae bacterium]
MKTKKAAHLVLTIILSLFSCIAAMAQEGGSGKIIVSIKDDYYVAFSPTPTTKSTSAPGWSFTFAEVYFESHTIRRVFVDGSGTQYFGYVISVEPVDSTRQFRISVRPLSPEDENELRARKSFQTRKLHPNYNAAGLARFSAPQIINDGDTFALDVLVNPQTGDRITDIVTISAEIEPLSKAPVSDPPRDFTLEDVEMKMINYRLLVNGQLVAGGKQSGACAGPIIWFHLPEKPGRFIFSLMPHPGYDFKQVGTVERNKIKFTLDGEQFEWVSNTPVVSAAGNWNLYVLYDKAYVPDPFLLGVNGAAKGENRSPSKLSEVEAALRKIETTYPSSRRAAATGFGKPSNSRKEDEADKSPGARLVIGAADRVENLLPKN